LGRLEDSLSSHAFYTVAQTYLPCSTGGILKVDRVRFSGLNSIYDNLTDLLFLDIGMLNLNLSSNTVSSEINQLALPLCQCLSRADGKAAYIKFKQI